MILVRDEVRHEFELLEENFETKFSTLEISLKTLMDDAPYQVLKFDGSIQGESILVLLDTKVNHNIISTKLI